VLVLRLVAVQPQETPATAEPTPPPPSPQTTVLTPPFGEGGQLADPKDNWSLSGGEILRYYGSPSAEACRQDCDKDLACRGYTWVKPGGYRPGDPPVCYLMRSFTNANQHTCCVSATRDPFPGK
jgi:hypothetical protein